MLSNIIHYKRVGLIKRTFVAILDIVFLLVLVFIFAFTSLGIFINTSYFISSNETLISIKNDSKLFKDNIEYSYILKNDDTLTINEKSERLNEVITNFYISLDNLDLNNNYYESYLNRKLDAKSNELNLFIKVNEEVIRSNNGISDTTYFDFYLNEYSSYSVPILYSTSEYETISKNIVMINLTIIVISILISGLIIYLVFPLIFKRDHATLAMKIFKLGLINQSGLSLENKEFFFRFLFLYIVEFILGILSLFIIPLISYSYMILSKKESPFHDALINVLMVDKNTNKIYLTKNEYLKDVNSLISIN